VKKVTSFIQKFVPESKLVEDNMTELCYQLPDEAARRGDFERLFQKLEHKHIELGLSSFGISDTSLEEVVNDFISQVLILNGLISDFCQCA